MAGQKCIARWGSRTEGAHPLPHIALYGVGARGWLDSCPLCLSVYALLVFFTVVLAPPPTLWDSLTLILPHLWLEGVMRSPKCLRGALDIGSKARRRRNLRMMTSSTLKGAGRMDNTILISVESIVEGEGKKRIRQRLGPGLSTAWHFGWC